MRFHAALAAQPALIDGGATSLTPNGFAQLTPAGVETAGDRTISANCPPCNLLRTYSFHPHLASHLRAVSGPEFHKSQPCYCRHPLLAKSGRRRGLHLLLLVVQLVRNVWDAMKHTSSGGR